MTGPKTGGRSESIIELGSVEKAVCGKCGGTEAVDGHCTFCTPVYIDKSGNAVLDCACETCLHNAIIMDGIKAGTVFLN